MQHNILFEKYKTIGIEGPTLKLLKSYQSIRKQIVQIDQVLSTEMILTCGVAQGSFLSTTELSIYINDIFSVICR